MTAGSASTHVVVPGVSMRQTLREFGVGLRRTRLPFRSRPGRHTRQERSSQMDHTSALRLLVRGPQRVRKAVRNELHHLAQRLPVQHHVVLYEAYGGRGVLCHPEALFRDLLKAEDLQHLHHIWALRDLKATSQVMDELPPHDPRVTFIRYGSMKYTRALATAGYLVNNTSFRPNFAKRDDQVYVNTWHGTPLKKMGHDEPGEARATRNVLRNFLMCDYVVSS